MSQSNLTEALTAAMREAGYVQKDAKNNQQGYSYASADAVLTKVRDILTANGVPITAAVADLVKYETTTNAKGNPVQRAVVKIELEVRDAEGKTAIWQGHGEGMDSGDKAVMKANTAALKYALAAGLLISWGDDPEADEKTDKEAKAAPKKVVHDPEAVLETIDQAMTMDALKAAKEKVIAFRDSDKDMYNKLVAEWKHKEMLLKGNGHGTTEV